MRRTQSRWFTWACGLVLGGGLAWAGGGAAAGQIDRGGHAIVSRPKPNPSYVTERYEPPKSAARPVTRARQARQTVVRVPQRQLRAVHTPSRRPVAATPAVRTRAYDTRAYDSFSAVSLGVRYTSDRASVAYRSGWSGYRGHHGYGAYRYDCYPRYRYHYRPRCYSRFGYGYYHRPYRHCGFGSYLKLSFRF